MVSRAANFCIDAHDPRAQVAWWSQVLDDFVPDDDGEEGDDEAGLRGPGGRWLLFLKVPESKTVKNRMHMCLRPVDRTRDEEVHRLLGLGATVVNDLRNGDTGWAVLADPEGNEFCVLTRSAQEAGIARLSVAPRLTPRDTRYVDVNGVHMYVETYGDGTPLVLLHGGMLTIDLDFGSLIPTLAERHRVVGVELQGHGRTADIDRPITPAALAADVVAMLDQLGIDRAHVLGHSMGAAVALELAVNHADRVRSVVAASASVRPDGMHEDLTDPEKTATSTRLPTAQDFADFTEAYRRLSPHPDHFDEFLARLSASNADLRGWSDEQLAAITAPTLLVMGDHDFTTVEHAALMLRLIPGSRLAILPGTTHMQVTRRADVLLPMLADFLD